MKVFRIILISVCNGFAKRLKPHTFTQTHRRTHSHRFLSCIRGFASYNTCCFSLWENTRSMFIVIAIANWSGTIWINHLNQFRARRLCRWLACFYCHCSFSLSFSLVLILLFFLLSFSSIHYRQFLLFRKIECTKLFLQLNHPNIGTINEHWWQRISEFYLSSTHAKL